jgi:hypothetical protein
MHSWWVKVANVETSYSPVIEYNKQRGPAALMELNPALHGWVQPQSHNQQLGVACTDVWYANSCAFPVVLRSTLLQHRYWV